MVVSAVFLLITFRTVKKENVKHNGGREKSQNRIQEYHKGGKIQLIAQE